MSEHSKILEDVYQLALTETALNDYSTDLPIYLSASVSCRYYKLNINNSDVIEIDVDNMIRKINGTDVMSEIRDALGI